MQKVFPGLPKKELRPAGPSHRGKLVRPSHDRFSIGRTRANMISTASHSLKNRKD
jgi:hypothetical protein